MDAPQTMEGRDNVIFNLSRLLVPVCELEDGARQTIACNAEVLRLPPDSALDAADDSAWLTYLVKGELAIRSTDGLLEVIPGGSGRARRPLFNAYPQGLHAIARTQSLLLRFDRTLFRSLLEQQRQPRHRERALNGQQLFARVYSSWFDDSLPLPAMTLAVHCLHGDGAPSHLRGLVEVLQSYPVLAQEFILAGNRSRNGQPPVKTAAEAALRLSLTGARILAICLGVRPLFMAKTEAARRLTDRVFSHSLLIGTLCFLLARRHTGLDPYRMLLAGLVHEVGALAVPLYLDHRPETRAADEAFTTTMRRLRAVVGPALLTRLGFDERIAAAAEQSEHWHRASVSPQDADVLVVAHLIAAQEDPGVSAPPYDAVPAFSRVCPHASRADMIALLRQAIRLSAAVRRRWDPDTAAASRA